MTLPKASPPIVAGSDATDRVKRVARAMAALRGDAEGDGAVMDMYGDLAVAAIEAHEVALAEAGFVIGRDAVTAPAKVIGRAVRSRLVCAADANPAGQAAVEALTEAGWIIGRRDDAAKVAELVTQLNEARAEIARLHGHTSGHDEPCLMCGEPCNGVAGNPFLWPLRLGNNGWHHVGCVSHALHEWGLVRAIVQEAVARSDSEAGFRDDAARWIATAIGLKVKDRDADDCYESEPRTTHPLPAEVAADMIERADKVLSDWRPDWPIGAIGDATKLIRVLARALTEYGDQRARQALEAAASAVEKYSPGTGHVVRALLTRPT